MIRPVLLPNSPLVARRKAQYDIVEWLSQTGRFHRHTVFSLKQTIGAHQMVESGKKKGTVIVSMD